MYKSNNPTKSAKWCECPKMSSYFLICYSGFSGALTLSPCPAGSKFSSALGSLVLSLSHHALQAPSSPVLWVLWCSHSLTMPCMPQVLHYSGFSVALTFTTCSKSSACSKFSSALGSLVLSLSHQCHHALHAPSSLSSGFPDTLTLSLLL